MEIWFDKLNAGLDASTGKAGPLNGQAFSVTKFSTSSNGSLCRKSFSSKERYGMNIAVQDGLEYVSLKVMVEAFLRDNVENIARAFTFNKCILSLLLISSSACSSRPPPELSTVLARRVFDAHCFSSGEKITTTVDDVEGVLLMGLRSSYINFADQFKLDDPYGSDGMGDGYVKSFLSTSYDLRLLPESARSRAMRASRPVGYTYVDVIDGIDGMHYRYTSRLEEPWQNNNKDYLKGYFRSVLQKVRVDSDLPRYGVSYEDISTRRDRELWIAGSSLKVIDLHTNKVIGERIGYMFDAAQGSTTGGRSPWLLATRNACPSFGPSRSSSSQIGQTIKFVEKILHSKNR